MRKSLSGILTLILCLLPLLLWAGLPSPDSNEGIQTESEEDSIRAERYLSRAGEFMKSDYDSAIFWAQRARSLSSESDLLSLSAKSLMLEGNAWYFKGVHDSSLALYFRAAELYRSAGDEPGEAYSWNEIGVLYRKQGDMDKALEALEKALDLSAKSGDLEQMANAYNNISVIYTMKGEFEKAIQYVHNSSRIKKKLNDEIGLSYDYVNLGINFAELGQIDSSLYYLKKSLAIRKKNADRHGLAMAYANMGEVAAGDGQFEKAVAYLDTALDISRSIQYKDLTKHIYRTLSGLYEGEGMSDSALLYYKRYGELKDSIFNKARSEQLLELQTKYDTAEKDRLIAEKELAVKKRNIWLGLFGGGFFLLVVSLVYLGIYNRKKQEFLKKEAVLKEELARKEMQNRIKNERLRISRDLHDNIGAELTLITSALDSKAYETRDEREKEWLNDVSDYARQAMSDLRETIWAFKSDNMPVHELVARVRAFTGKISSMTGIEIETKDDVSEDIRLTPGQVINLYRISQEALQNAVKYANGKKICWEIKWESGQLCVAITDNGVGFDPEKIKKGYGLSHMCERMEELNGRCEIRSRVGEGTSIVATLPLAESTI